MLPFKIIVPLYLLSAPLLSGCHQSQDLRSIASGLVQDQNFGNRYLAPAIASGDKVLWEVVRVSDNFKKIDHTNAARIAILLGKIGTPTAAYLARGLVESIDWNRVTTRVPELPYDYCLRPSAGFLALAEMHLLESADLYRIAMALDQDSDMSVDMASMLLVSAVGLKRSDESAKILERIVSKRNVEMLPPNIADAIALNGTDATLNFLYDTLSEWEPRRYPVETRVAARVLDVGPLCLRALMINGRSEAREVFLAKMRNGEYDDSLEFIETVLATTEPWNLSSLHIESLRSECVANLLIYPFIFNLYTGVMHLPLEVPFHSLAALDSRSETTAPGK